MGQIQEWGAFSKIENVRFLQNYADYIQLHIWYQISLSFEGSYGEIKM